MSLLRAHYTTAFRAPDLFVEAGGIVPRGYPASLVLPFAIGKKKRMDNFLESINLSKTTALTARYAQQLRNEGCDKVIAIGSSLGVWPALRIATAGEANTVLNAVVGLSPMFSWPDRPALTPENLKVPTLLIGGSKDEKIPDMQAKLSQWSKHPLVASHVIDGVKHTFDHEAMREKGEGKGFATMHNFDYNVDASVLADGFILMWLDKLIAQWEGK